MRFDTYLIEKDKTQADVAREFGVSRQYLNLIIHGKRKAPRMRHKLVKAGYPIPKQITASRRAA